MTSNFNNSEVTKKINLEDGLSLVLLDRLAKESTYGTLQCARNVFLVLSDTKIVWQISTDFDSDGGSFTNILLQSDTAKAFRWDGGIYDIDLETGRAIPTQLLK